MSVMSSVVLNQSLKSSPSVAYEWGPIRSLFIRLALIVLIRSNYKYLNPLILTRIHLASAVQVETRRSPPWERPTHLPVN